MPIRIVMLSDEMTVGDMVEVLADYYMNQSLRGSSYQWDMPRQYHLAYLQMLAHRTTEELRVMVKPLFEFYPQGYRLPT